MLNYFLIFDQLTQIESADANWIGRRKIKIASADSIFVIGLNLRHLWRKLVLMMQIEITRRLITNSYVNMIQIESDDAN